MNNEGIEVIILVVLVFIWLFITVYFMEKYDNK